MWTGPSQSRGHRIPTPAPMKCSELSRGFFPLRLGVKSLKLSARPSSQQPPDARPDPQQWLLPTSSGCCRRSGPGLLFLLLSLKPGAPARAPLSPTVQVKLVGTAQCLVPRWTLEGWMTAADPCPWGGWWLTAWWGQHPKDHGTRLVPAKKAGKASRQDDT